MNELKHVKDRVVCRIDLDYKNWHTFSDGTKIARPRQYNELNRRITEPVNAVVVSAENIPSGSEILIHPNEIHDSNKIFNFIPLSGEDAASSVKYYSINEYQCFIWRDAERNKWMPLKGFETGLRVFKPYVGFLTGIDPSIIKDVLYITSGEFEGQVCHTLRSSDYCIVFQNVDGKEGQIIRVRHYEGICHDREEIVCIDYSLTKRVESGELLVGIEVSDCHKLNFV